MNTNAPRSAPARPSTSIAPAATALAVLAGAGSAAAQVVHFTPTGSNSVSNSGGTLYVDLDLSNNPAGVSTTDGTGAELAFTFYGGAYNPALSFGPKPSYVKSVYIAPHFYIDKVSAPAVIGPPIYPGTGWYPAPPPGYFKPLATNGTGPWSGGGSGYIGFNTLVNAGRVYGWLDLTYDNLGGTLTVNDWAYNAQGNPVIAGSLVAIPEPATTSSLIGAAILAGSTIMMRRRREKLAAAAAWFG